MKCKIIECTPSLNVSGIYITVDHSKCGGLHHIWVNGFQEFRKHYGLVCSSPVSKSVYANTAHALFGSHSIWTSYLNHSLERGCSHPMIYTSSTSQIFIFVDPNKSVPLNLLWGEKYHVELRSLYRARLLGQFSQHHWYARVWRTGAAS